MPGRAPGERGGKAPGPGRGPPGPAGPPGRDGKAPGPGRGPPPAGMPGRAAAGRGGMLGMPPGRGPAGEPGRGGSGAAGRGGREPPSSGVVKGLLPGRGPGAVDGRDGSGATWLSSAGAGAAGTSATGDSGTGAGAGSAFLAGAFLAGAGAAAAAAAWAGNASRTLRATGGSIVDEALLTNSPLSFNQDRRALLSMPSSLASSWTRALPGTVLLLLKVWPGSSQAVVVTAWRCSSVAHRDKPHRVLMCASRPALE
jgi:hypothetical protein